MQMFAKLDYKDWCAGNGIDQLFDINLNTYTQEEPSLYQDVDPENSTPFPVHLNDLTRLHYLVRSRRVTTILEFGVGKSTVVFADAIKQNKLEYGDFVSKNFRKAHPFEVHSVDNVQHWIDTCKKNFSPKELMEFVHFHFSEVEMTTFNGRACTMYKTLPNLCPDLIYLDAPGQFNVTGDVRGISTAQLDRMPMAADILMLEPFLVPGTLIVVDGRTANARFLRNNLQRTWEYHHYFDEDIHTLELVEPPLGKLNEKQLRFCLGDSWPGLRERNR